ncbi:type VII secretion-associated serine protease mycosin [Actinomadura vinacea]|uniref:Type VII secretion-associated serine protease mycosin n=1 Tax=Actinomadura vinacea TaxID=115336 RepID=A0ABN3J320_9ACTN
MRLRRLAAAVLLAAVAVPGLAPVAHADEVRARQRSVMATLEVETAWKTTRGAGVTVAVVDSGVDARQADLAGSVINGPNMLEGIDAGTRPARLHGTGMASLIAGHGHGPGGRDGVMGIAPEAKILGIRSIAEQEDAGYAAYRTSPQADDSVARGIRYAADNGADVINLSLGKNDVNPEERAAIGHAIGKGVVVVSAVGNDGDKRGRLDGDGFAPYSYPASFPGVIGVAATDARHGRAGFSNRNYSVVVSAPGSGLPVAAPGGEYFLTDGTSDSSALVSGIAALIRSRHPKMPPTLVAQALIQGTKHGPGGTYDPGVGFGEVNAARALSAADGLTRPRAGAAGKAAGQRFGPADPGPVNVIERPGWVTAVIVIVTTVGVAGAVAALAIAITLARRHPRNALQPGLALAATAPRGPAGPWGAPDPWRAPPPNGPPRTAHDISPWNAPPPDGPRRPQ